MLKNYFKIAWRNLVKSKGYAFINIAGLATGMAVAILIGLWIYDEVSFDRSFKNYDRIGQVWQNVTFEVETGSYTVTPAPLAEEMRNKYPDFKRVSLYAEQNLILTTADKKFSKTGTYAEPDFTEMMTLNMKQGTRNGLKEVNSVLLSQTLAKAFFGSEDPMNKIIKVDNKASVKVTGVYEDFPDNSKFRDISFIAPWSLYEASNDWVKKAANEWDNNSFNIYVELKEGANFASVSTKIKDARMKQNSPPAYKPQFFIHPMSRWHLYTGFKNGVYAGGAIDFVWLFGIIGVFVLLLACINFMNLSTARSEKRAKEVGIRKAIGSMRWQLIKQFFSESFLVVAFAFVLSLLLVQLVLPFFNGIAGKKMSVLWLNPYFWLIGIGFSLVTGLIAGSYPALYLSSFKPVKVLKGTFRAGRLATIPRKTLVVVQFSVSIALIIGTIVVFRQIQFVKDRPIGYNRNGLIEVNMNTPDLYKNFAALRNELLNSGAVEDMAESSGSVTVQFGGSTNVSWQGKAANTNPLVMSNTVTHEYGKTVGWQLAKGRDFSRAFADSSSMILNESAAKMMGFKNPVGELVKWNNAPYRVIGVVKDMIKESPFQPVKATFFALSYIDINVISVKLAPKLGVRKALTVIEPVFRKYNPESPFDYKFVDDEYAKKFDEESRIGQLAAFFAILAIFISCLGLFGVASFVAEQRTKEIGVRKVIGASVFNVWQLLSKEFIVLVIISLFFAIPTAYYYMHTWLEKYPVRAPLSWWIFAVAGIGAVVITILTVSFQAIKAAVANPIRSLRTE